MKLSKIIDKDLLSIDSEKGKLTLFGLAIPLFIESLGTNFINIITTMMSANFMDGFFVSPTGIVGNILGYAANVASIISTGASILLSIYLGKRREADCKSIVGTVIFLDFLLSTVLYTCTALFAKPLLAFMGYNAPEYAVYYPYALKYLRIRSFTMLLFHLHTIFLVVLRCYGYPKYGLLTTTVGSAVNAVCVGILYYVIKIPKESVITCLSLTTVFVALLDMALTLFIFRRKKIPVSFNIRWKWIKKTVVIGLPGALASIVYGFSNILTTRLCVMLSPDAYLAKVYVSQIVLFVYLFGIKIANANSMMVGRLCGMGDLDKANRFQHQNYRIVVFFNCLISLIFLALSRPIYEYGYNANDAVMSFVIPIMAIDVIVEIGRGMNHIGQNGLNATGDVNFTTGVSIIAAFVVVGIAYVLGIWLEMGIIGMWIAFAIDEITRGTIYLIRWNKGGWRKGYEKKFGQDDTNVDGNGTDNQISDNRVQPDKVEKTA